MLATPLVYFGLERLDGAPNSETKVPGPSRRGLMQRLGSAAYLGFRGYQVLPETW